MLALFSSLAVVVVTQSSARITVDWDKPIGATTALSFGLNLFRGHDPVEAGSESYRKALAIMKPGLVRYHSWEAMGDSKTSGQGWIDTAHHAWDADKILGALACLPANQPAIVVNVPTWPDWMDPKHRGIPDDPSEFARWCADLAAILAKSSRHVRYLEITNEKDSAFYVDLRTNGGVGTTERS